MEELMRIAKAYYRNTVRMQFFGAKGACFLLFSLSSYSAAILGYILGHIYFVSFVKEYPGAFLFSFVIVGVAGAIFFAVAQTVYNTNLRIHLSGFTHLLSGDTSAHKAMYLHYLVSPISNNLYDAMKVLKEIKATSALDTSFSAHSEWSRFVGWVYNPEAKNRIMSLCIYLISLIALLMLTKFSIGVDGSMILATMDQLFSKSLVSLVFLGLMTIYGITTIIVFIYKFFVVPFMLRYSNEAMLSNFLISELNRYAYLDQRILQDESVSPIKNSAKSK